MAKRVILQVLSFLGIDFAAAIGYTAVGRSQPINPQGSSELPAKNTLGDMRAIVDINQKDRIREYETPVGCEVSVKITEGQRIAVQVKMSPK